MRWFKCLLLAAAHTAIHLSVIWVPRPNTDGDNEFLKWFFVAMGSMVGTVCVGLYVIMMPFKIRQLWKNRFLIMLSIAVYTAFLSIMLWAFQAIVDRDTVLEVYSVAGTIGLIFGLLVLYDKMKGESTQDLYERVMEQLGDDVELDDLECNKIGIDDDDVHRLH